MRPFLTYTCSAAIACLLFEAAIHIPVPLSKDVEDRRSYLLPTQSDPSFNTVSDGLGYAIEDDAIGGITNESCRSIEGNVHKGRCVVSVIFRREGGEPWRCNMVRSEYWTSVVQCSLKMSKRNRP